jgi:hypothetical protein
MILVVGYRGLARNQTTRTRIHVLGAAGVIGETKRHFGHFNGHVGGPAFSYGFGVLP